MYIMQSSTTWFAPIVLLILHSSLNIYYFLIKNKLKNHKHLRTNEVLIKQPSITEHEPIQQPARRPWRQFYENHVFYEDQIGNAAQRSNAERPSLPSNQSSYVNPLPPSLLYKASKRPLAAAIHSPRSSLSAQIFHSLPPFLLCRDPTMCEGQRAVCGAVAVHDADVVTTGGRRKIPAHSSVLVRVPSVLHCNRPGVLSWPIYSSSSKKEIFIFRFFCFHHHQASASPVLACIIERRAKKDRESGRPAGGRTVVRIRGVTDDAAAAFVRLLYAGTRYPLPPSLLELAVASLSFCTRPPLLPKLGKRELHGHAKPNYKLARIISSRGEKHGTCVLVGAVAPAQV
jgi:hypothetical protein